MKIIDLTGHRFGRLKVVQRNGTTASREIKWDCTCDCGTSVNVSGASLRTLHTQSCGCLHRETSAQLWLKHGMTQTLVGNTWIVMMQRCYNPKNPNFKNYGARGIGACEFVRSTPANLINLIGDRTNKRQTLERIDNGLGYNCGACAECLKDGHALNLRWATRAEQLRNTRRNRRVEIDGVVKCATDWAIEMGIKRTTFFTRHVDKMPVADGVIKVLRSDVKACRYSKRSC